MMTMTFNDRGNININIFAVHSHIKFLYHICSFPYQEKSLPKLIRVPSIVYYELSTRGTGHTAGIDK